MELAVVGVVAVESQPVDGGEVALRVLLVDLGHEPLSLAGLLRRAHVQRAVATHHDLGTPAWKDVVRRDMIKATTSLLDIKRDFQSGSR